MFGFGKKKTVKVGAPVAGKVIDITDVPDDVFSSKMMGDGFAVEPESEEIVAPADGVITLVAKTGHAIAIDSNGIEILVHVGLDTVDLQGMGFSVQCKQGDTVRRGKSLLRVNRDMLKKNGKPLTTMVVITNMDKVKKLDKDLSGQDILTLEIK